MYDLYRHGVRVELQLTVPRGAELPNGVSKANWRFVGRQLSVPQIVADEIQRSGFSITRPTQQKARSRHEGFGKG